MFDDPLVLLIPFISAFVGWGTNVVAVQMMFHPLDFVGIKPWFGWQGIVPANARSLAAKSTDIITGKLINLRMLFDDFDAEGFAGNLDAALDEIVDQIIEETAEKYAKDMWASMAEPVQAQVRTMLRAEVEAVAVKILQDMSDNIEEILDLKGIVMESAHRDRGLIGEMFQTVGVEEFKFIKRSGAYFGFAFGIVQMFAWIAYPAWWVLPFFGFFVGYVTNWLALKLIFEPAEPKKIGPLTVQGLFHKRQHAVSKAFSTMVASDIINPDNMVSMMTTGKPGDALFGFVEARVGELIDKYKANPMTSAMVPAGEWDGISTELFTRIRQDMGKPEGFLYTFTSRAVNVAGELFDRMTELDSKSFEGILRPPFQADEWKLIVAGAALGLGAGVLQILFLFGG